MRDFSLLREPRRCAMLIVLLLSTPCRIRLEDRDEEALRTTLARNRRRAFGE